MTKPSINAAVLKRAEDFRRQPALWEEREHGAVVAVLRQTPLLRFRESRLFLGRERALGLGRVVDVTVEREGVERVGVLLRVSFGERSVGGAQVSRVALVRAELYLPGGVRGEDFVELEVERRVFELGDVRRKMNRAPVAYALLVGHGRERHDLDRVTRQSLDVEAQSLRDLFEREPALLARLQLLVAAPRLKREVATARARRDVLAEQPFARPSAELLDRHGAQRDGRGAHAGDGRLRVHARDLLHGLYHFEREVARTRAARVRRVCERAERLRPCARERDETGVVVRRDRTQQRAPSVERRGEEPQHFAARDEHVKRRRAAAV